MSTTDSPAAAPAAAIRVERLTKRFGAQPAVDQLSFEVARGETVVLWGANGAGKTTVLRCVLGVLPFEGSIRVFGHDAAREGKAVRWMLGYVPQELGLPGDATVWEAAMLYAQLRRVPASRATDVLHAWQLGGAARQLVRTLSGGMKQKLAVAIALLSDPPILLLDEPTSHLDVRSRGEFTALLKRLQGEGKTLVLCSHRMSEAMKLADRVIVLERGRAVRCGTPEEVRGAINREALLGIMVPPEQHAAAVDALKRQGLDVHVLDIEIESGQAQRS
ncbi:MAG: ABC transporter ATP-binding protein [Candidatus Omnitrophica bacterium]|nr:ABC transporter ATP-binding protein [Candidatus Omnitrophota bacterium]